MADAMVERRPPPRFFCHRCNIEFEDVLQDYTCPYCASGFIEQLENEGETLPLSGDDFSDADMSNIDDISNIDDMDDSDEVHQMTQGTPPMLNDLAFLMSGGRLRGAGRRETLMEQLVWMIGGARPGMGAVTAGAPFVLVGAPGDYVFGGEGLDAVVTQLLGQLENAGPPPLPREQLAALPSEPVTEAQAAANTSCSVCWENFQLGETVSRLSCDHIFHSSCISPWLQLHATCPICRRSQLPEAPAAATAPTSPPTSAPPPTSATAPAAPTPTPTPASTTTASTTPVPRTDSTGTSFSHMLVRRIPRRRVGGVGGVGVGAGAGAGGVGVGVGVGGARVSWSPLDALGALGALATGHDSGSGSTSGSVSTASSGVWAPPSRSNTNSNSNSSSSLNSNDRDRQYNMDIDFD